MTQRTAEFLKSRFEGGDVPTQEDFGDFIDSVYPVEVNVKAAPFLAKGDGVTDDTAAIQAALDSLGRGQGLFFPYGNYPVSATLTSTQRGIRLYSDSGISARESSDPDFVSGTVIRATVDSMTLFDYNNGGVIIHEGPTIENINFIDTTPTGNTATLIRLENCNRWTLRNVSLRDALVGLSLVKGASDNSWSMIDHPVVTFCTTGILTDGGFGFTMIGGVFEGCTTSVDLDDLFQAARFLGTKFDGITGGTGIIIRGQICEVIGCIFEDHDPMIQIIDTGSGQRGKRNAIIGCSFTGNGTETGITIGSGATDNQLMGNTFVFMGTNLSDSGTNTLAISSQLDSKIPGNLFCEIMQVQDGITAPGTVSGQAQIYVDTADGDLKVKFGDGFVAVIAADS